MSDTKIIPVAYRGGRTSYFVFHPVLQWNIDTRYNVSKDNFLRQLNTWYEVCELYKDDMVLSENVTPKSLKRDVMKVIAEIDQTHDVYLLEALAESLWDKEGAIQYEDGKFDGPSEKIQSHFLPMMSELSKRADELRAEDIGIRAPYQTTASMLNRRTWTG